MNLARVAREVMPADRPRRTPLRPPRLRRRQAAADQPLRIASSACAAASRAIGTRNGEHDT
jgi:hypothetical protein